MIFYECISCLLAGCIGMLHGEDVFQHDCSEEEFMEPIFPSKDIMCIGNIYDKNMVLELVNMKDDPIAINRSIHSFSYTINYLDNNGNNHILKHERLSEFHLGQIEVLERQMGKPWPRVDIWSSTTVDIALPKHFRKIVSGRIEIQYLSLKEIGRCNSESELYALFCTNSCIIPIEIRSKEKNSFKELLLEHKKMFQNKQ